MIINDSGMYSDHGIFHNYTYLVYFAIFTLMS
ncbi:uncharacterized protein METZ01_LOCUS236273 [marine metagenome]|uniref:Uncharacterized protein n=1 Tax=marine metagenome TaxID=408172 RepID=A0A382H8F4_9ZZZZ